MRILSLLVLITALFCPVVPAVAADFEARTDFRYQGWTSDADESGYQFYWPVYLRSALDRWRVELVAGYAATGGKLSGNGDRSISGLLDSQLNVAYTLPKTLGMDWLIGVDTNLPTGQTGEDSLDLKIMLDSDLVTIVSPGKGLDFNPFVNLARRLEAWTLGLGLGYAFQGEYDYSATDLDYDPGDIFNVATEILYDWQGGWQARLFGQYATFGTDTLAGEDLVKRGDTWLAGAGFRFDREVYVLGLSLQTINRDKSQYRSTTGTGIVAESQNSYGAEWHVTLDGQYRFSEATSVTAKLSYVNMAANGYASDSLYYVGQRIKTALSLGVGHALNDRVQLQAGLEGFLMDDDPNWLHPGEARTYRGWAVSVAAVTRF